MGLPARQEIFAAAVNSVAEQIGRPRLYDASGHLIPTASYAYQRSAAKRTGSLRNWVPRRLFGNQSEALEREQIVERSIDLTQSDPHAAGVVEAFAMTVIGSGLTPQPAIDPDALGMEKEQARLIQRQMQSIYAIWAPFADAAGRMYFGAIQFLLQRCLMEFGEYVMLLPMLKDSSRPYSLACQVIHPLRLRTPSDKINAGNIRDGVEIGEYGQAVAYWIKRTDPSGRMLPDSSANFTRIPARAGHRFAVLHGFVQQSPEQVRGMPPFASAMKFFRDMNDYLDAELVSNIVTAAFSMFIETGSDPGYPAVNLATLTDTDYNADGDERSTRYQEMIPGQIMYGNTGEKPHQIAANRPGATFEPFIKIIKKALGVSIGMPYNVIFKDLEGMSFAGYRGAMLEAWRVFMTHRSRMGSGVCRPIYTMLMEEAYLRGDLSVSDFYSNMHALCRADWYGSPKGDIEPVKAAQADVLLIQNNLKTRAEAISERGGELRSTFEQLEEEEELMRERGLTEQPVAAQAETPDDEDEDAENGTM